MGVFPNMPADLGNLPVEALILLKEDLLVQQLVIDVLIKTASTSGRGHVGRYAEGDGHSARSRC